MSQSNELLAELENQMKQAEKMFIDNVNKLDNKELMSDMLNSFNKIKSGNMSSVELNKKAKEWQLNLDK